MRIPAIFALALLVIPVGCAAGPDPAFTDVKLDLPIHRLPSGGLLKSEFVGPEVLSREKALELAAANPALLASAGRLAAAGGDFRQASVSPNPKMSLSTENVSLEKPAWPGATTKFSLSQEIELGGKRSARSELAKRKQNLAGASHEQVVANARLGVMMAFNGVLFAQENEALHKAILDATVKLHEIAAAKLQTGKISRREFLQFEAALGEARLAHENAAAAKRPALAELSAAIGVKRGLFATKRCQGSLGQMTRPGDEESYLMRMATRLDENSPALHKALAGVKAAQGALALERAKRWPHLTMGVMFARIESKYENAVGASLGLTLPVWDANSGAVDAASSRLQAAKNELAQVENEVAARFKVLEERLLTARRSIRAYDTSIIPAAQESHEIAVSAFKAGRLSYVETLEPLISLLKARKARLDWLRRYSDTAAELDALAPEGEK